jgi:hypothetical protein
MPLHSSRKDVKRADDTWRLAGRTSSNGGASAEPKLCQVKVMRLPRTRTHENPYTRDTSGVHVGCVRQLSMLAAAEADHHNSRLHSLQRPVNMRGWTATRHNLQMRRFRLCEHVASTVVATTHQHRCMMATIAHRLRSTCSSTPSS